jgi:hypothetical protein
MTGSSASLRCHDWGSAGRLGKDWHVDGERDLHAFATPPPRIALLALLCAFAAPACSTTHESSVSAKENATMTAEATISENAALSAQEVGKRVLALIENVRSKQDISPEVIEKHTGLPIQVNPEDGNDYGVSGKLTEQWYYGLRSMSGTPGEKPNRLLFQFNDQTHSDADMSPVCIAFEDYSQALTAAGFTPKRLRNRLDTEDYWDFSRGDIGVTVYLRGKANPKDTQACVSMLIINAYA